MVNFQSTWLTLSVSMILVSGCAEIDTPETDTLGQGLTYTEQEQAGLLEMVNICQGGVSFFDDEVGLRHDAADNLVAHRDGADGACGTADDDPFDDVPEIDAVPRIGEVALQTLLDYARANGWVAGPEDPAGVWDGVAFTVGEVLAVLDIVNNASLEVLDVDIALDSRAARYIVAARPIGDIGRLAAVAYVGTSALTRLRDYVPVWTGVGTEPPEDDPVAGTWEDVEFTVFEVATTLEIVNRATFSQLNTGASLSVLASNRIIAARPIASMDTLSNVEHVGSTALERIRRYVPVWIEQGGAGDLTLTAEDKLVLCINDPSVTAVELDGVQYIGSMQAQAIIAYRDEDRIDGVDELLAVVPLTSYQLSSLIAYAGEWYVVHMNDL